MSQISHKDSPRWRCEATLRKYDADVDEYRAKWGREEGEARFFRDLRPRDVVRVPENLFLVGGTSLLWRCVFGDGTSTAGQTNTYLNLANAHLAVGDGAPSALTGTVSATNDSATITFSSSQTGLAGDYLTFSGDATFGVYRVASGSGTSWTLASPYKGATAAGMIANKIVGEKDDQTDLVATTNKARQGMDSGFPKHSAGSTVQAITGATNDSPIVVSCVNSYAEGDFVFISGVGGNTAANGLWRISNVTGTDFALDGSAGNANYTSGGIATRSRVGVLQATFGGSTANHAWNEWGVANAAAGAGVLLNRRVMAMGVKPGGSSWTLAAGLTIS